MKLLSRGGRLLADGSRLATDQCSPGCCAQTYGRAVDCCLATRHIWVPIDRTCASGQRLFSPGVSRVFRINGGNRCWSTDPDPESPKSREYILAIGEGSLIFDGSIDCEPSCDAPACEPCPPCCTSGEMDPERCTQRSGCVECGGSWVFELDTHYRVESRRTDIRSTVSTPGFYPPGWRPPDCEDASGAYWFWGALDVPTRIDEHRAYARVVMTCDDLGNKRFTCEYRAVRSLIQWDYQIPAIGEGEGDGPPVIGVYGVTETRQLDEPADCNAPGSLFTMGLPQGDGLCGTQPSGLLGAAWCDGVTPLLPSGEPWKTCAGSVHTHEPIDLSGYSPCATQYASRADDRGAAWTGTANEYGGAQAIRSWVQEAGLLQHGRCESTHAAAWTMTPLYPCPPGTSPCDGSGLLRFLRAIT